MSEQECVRQIVRLWGNRLDWLSQYAFALVESDTTTSSNNICKNRVNKYDRRGPTSTCQTPPLKVDP
eukprot:scaffold18122_cov194-Amphora_coffeaeformis.AAC.6